LARRGFFLIALGVNVRRDRCFSGAELGGGAPSHRLRREGMVLMALRNGVVVHFLDGRVLKGNTQDFSPKRQVFHLFPADGSPGFQIRMQDLKAAFFVKTLEGDADRPDLKGFIAGPAENAHGTKIAVLFSDGELLCGHSMGYSPHRPGFFLVPTDEKSNNKRVFVNVGDGVEVAQGELAERLAQRILDSKAA